MCSGNYQCVPVFRCVPVFLCTAFHLHVFVTKWTNYEMIFLSTKGRFLSTKERFYLRKEGFIIVYIVVLPYICYKINKLLFERKVWSTKGRFGLWKEGIVYRRFCLQKECFIFIYSCISVAVGIGVGYQEDPRWAKKSTTPVRGVGGGGGLKNHLSCTVFSPPSIVVLVGFIEIHEHIETHLYSEKHAWKSW